MAKLLDAIAAAQGALVWIEDTQYSERLLAGGKSPWGDAAQYLAYRRKAAGLLKPGVNVVPLGSFASAWVSARPDLKEAMGARKRAVVPVRTLLADEAFRAHLIDTLQGLRSAFASAPLVLALPSPRAWVRDAYQLAFGDDVAIEVAGDEADSCAVYVAEFLRCFGDIGVDGLLLEEKIGAEPASAEEIEWYQPVINVAAHYRWDIGLRFVSGDGFSGEVRGIDFVIAPGMKAGAINGVAVPDSFWGGEDAPEATNGGFRYLSIPQDAVPEKVLERLATLQARVH